MSYSHEIRLVSQPTFSELLRHDGVHTYLKEACESFSWRDPVDALKDAELLVAACAARLESMERAEVTS